jgi:hypothetical protein
MNESQMVRPRSGDQWNPRRSAGPSITVIVSDPPANDRRIPFGFGIREEEPAQVEAEWEGNPS